MQSTEGADCESKRTRHISLHGFFQAPYTPIILSRRKAMRTSRSVPSTARDPASACPEDLRSMAGGGRSLMTPAEAAARHTASWSHSSRLPALLPAVRRPTPSAAAANDTPPLCACAQDHGRQIRVTQSGATLCSACLSERETQADVSTGRARIGSMSGMCDYESPAAAKDCGRYAGMYVGAARHDARH